VYYFGANFDEIGEIWCIIMMNILVKIDNFWYIIVVAILVLKFDDFLV
jgi:hypothetical protein